VTLTIEFSLTVDGIIEGSVAVPVVSGCVVRIEKMTEQVVRCPYCVLGNYFVPMLSRPEGWFICSKCGHSAIPEKPEFRCFCQKCGELKRAA